MIDRNPQGTMTNQSFTFIDPAGNQAQYTVYGADYRNEFHWSTDHGDSGFDASFEQAQSRARTALKNSMAARRRSDERAPRR
jgi:peptide methionine sulfoxide reductase MsrA